MDPEIAAKLAIRDRFRRRIDHARPVAERMELMSRMQAQAWRVLQGSPQGLTHFMRRNFRQRVTPHSERDAR
jgi:hypothetical protein